MDILWAPPELLRPIAGSWGLLRAHRQASVQTTALAVHSLALSLSRPCQFFSRSLESFLVFVSLFGDRISLCIVTGLNATFRPGWP